VCREQLNECFVAAHKRFTDRALTQNYQGVLAFSMMHRSTLQVGSPAAATQFTSTSGTARMTITYLAHDKRAGMQGPVHSACRSPPCAAVHVDANFWLALHEALRAL